MTPPTPLDVRDVLARCPLVPGSLSPWLDAEGLRVYLNLKSRAAACEWVRKRALPKADHAKFLVRVENVDRVLCGLAPLPHSAFLRRR